MGNAMRSMSAHDAKARFGQLLDAARIGPVAINKHGRAVAVVISKEEYDAIEAIKLEKLRLEVQKGIQSIEQGDFDEFGPAEIRQFGDSIKSRGRGRKKAK
jgi:prevent-host-death family protein